jgi:5-hydroxyisourate hydrolase-like protein (transthyretin family)
VEFNASAPLEGLTQTDASGRYRIEVAPGRYYIATGSVNAPTFFPGTTTVEAARVFTVSSGGLIEAIDFTSYVPALQTGIRGPFVPLGTGALSGNLRFPDGTPAQGVIVIVVAASPAAAPGLMPTVMTLANGIAGIGRASSDSNGRYVLQSLPAGTYYVAAGFAEAPTFYPGVADIRAATTIAVTATTNLSNLDFTVPRPPVGVTVSGQVTGIGDVPARGATVVMNSSLPPPGAYGLPPSRPPRSIPVAVDGRFEFANVFPGPYTLQASNGNLQTELTSLTVGAEPIAELKILIRAAAVSGRILWEDDTAIPAPLLFGEAILSTASNPNIVMSTLLPIAHDGTFSRLLGADEYRFYLRQLPQEYSIVSIRAGNVDLLKETLKFTGTEPVNLEVRVAKRVVSGTGVSVAGRVLDAVTAAPSTAVRITLCCLDGGVTQRYSSPLRSDGSFLFEEIPPGHYGIGLQTPVGSPNLLVVERDVVVKDQNISGLDFSSTSGFGELSANLVVEGGTPSVLAPSAMSVVFTGSNGRVRVTAQQRLPNGPYYASLPVGDRYTVSVLNLPEGFVLKSVLGSTEVRPRNNPPVGLTPVVPVVITLAPASK